MSFEKIFNSSSAKLLDVLSKNKERDFSLTELARLAGVSYRTAQRIFPTLIQEQLVKKTRSIGRADLFMINLENAKMAALYTAVHGPKPMERLVGYG